MSGKNALILAGTGMLDKVVQTLIVEGWQVVLPSRRYNPIAFRGTENGSGTAARRALRPKGHLPTVGRDAPGYATWVEAQWERPHELARAAEKALARPADLLVAWVHDSDRRSVIGAVESLLDPSAPVVEVAGGRGSGPTDDPAEPALPGHPTQQVLLGTVSERDSGRALAQAEIVEGVLTAVRRALDGRPSSLHQLGQRRPLP
ncbi:hypothetical protein [Amycolatopsis cihanbeyliensis]|uniref:NAD(P)-binding protein n=1 Tax=Amycolatopsis cihanbeyliensis TaxID=1128664 RepID=A0A542DER3_AMYCI|nr:hypothetical protein [Amycolatopsis cihanbeyliensis]TQJ01562.1 hypothetical protein FB471_1250 [Amycolatopsis cihanbeyliensis]